MAQGMLSAEVPIFVEVNLRRKSKQLANENSRGEVIRALLPDCLGLKFTAEDVRVS